MSDEFENKPDIGFEGEFNPTESAAVQPIRRSKGGKTPSTPFQEQAPVEYRTVKLLNTDLHGGKLAVIDVDSKEAYLLPKEALRWTSGAQVIEKSVLDAAERPYNWDKELEQLFSTPQQVRIALWQSGAVTEEDAGKESLHSLIARLLQRGVLPVKEQS